MSEPLLQLSQITKTFKSGPETLHVLKGVDLTVNNGEFIAIMGPSGAGKTTLLNVAGGLMRPSSGSVRIAQQELFQQNDESLSRHRNQLVGFVFQLHYLLPEFTAQENVAMPALISGVKKATALERARELLEKMGLAGRIKHKPGELSGGEQQRVAIARALINGARLLLTDEPTGDLDQATAQEVHKLFLTLNREQGQTIILVTHNPELGNLTDRKIILKDGRIVQDGEVRGSVMPDLP